MGNFMLGKLLQITSQPDGFFKVSRVKLKNFKGSLWTKNILTSHTQRLNLLAVKGTKK